MTFLFYLNNFKLFVEHKIVWLSNWFNNNRYLDTCIAEGSEIRLASGPDVISKVSENIVGKHLAFRFIRDNWDTVVARYVYYQELVSHISYICQLFPIMFLISVLLFYICASRYEKALKLKPIMDVMQNRNTQSSLEEVMILVNKYKLGLHRHFVNYTQFLIISFKSIFRSSTSKKNMRKIYRQWRERWIKWYKRQRQTLLGWKNIMKKSVNGFPNNEICN